MSDTAVLTQTVATDVSNATIELEQATIDDIRERQLLYVRGKRSIVTCMDYPLVFWRNIKTDFETEFASSRVNEHPLDVAECGKVLSAHFFFSSMTSNIMSDLVSEVELHRSYTVCPEIFQIDPKDRISVSTYHTYEYDHSNYQGSQSGYDLGQFEEDFTFHDGNFVSYAGDHSSDDDDFAFDNDDEDEVHTHVHAFDATIDVATDDNDLFSLVAEQSVQVIDDVDQSLNALSLEPKDVNVVKTTIQTDNNAENAQSDDEWEATFD